MTCPIDGCIRGEGVEWGSGPTLCVPHRAEWAADHEKEISDGEWEHWANEYAYDTPAGQTFSTWPDNFKTADRAKAIAKLAAINAADRKKGAA